LISDECGGETSNPLKKIILNADGGKLMAES